MEIRTVVARSLIEVGSSEWRRMIERIAEAAPDVENAGNGRQILYENSTSVHIDKKECTGAGAGAGASSVAKIIDRGRQRAREQEST